MKRYYLYVFFFLLCLTGIVNAQKLDYPTEIVNGVECYLYPVEKSVGFFRLSRNFDVKKKVILEYNPEAKEGLKLGQILRIPVSEEHLEGETELANNKHVLSDEQLKKIDSTMYIQHVIQPKETLYRIGKKYDVEISTIIKLNPGLVRNMPIGATLLIPKSNKISPDFLANALQQQLTQTATPDPLLVDGYALSSETPIKIACLMPFMLDAPKFDPVVNRFLEFYQGMLLAINEKKKEGVRINLYVYDTEKTEMKVQNVLQKPEMQEMDLIIGPAYTQQVNTVAEFAKKHQIPAVIPFASQIEGIDENPYVYRINSTKKHESEVLSHLQVDSVYNFIYAHHATINQSRKSAVVGSMVNEIQQKNMPLKNISIGIQNLDSLELLLDTVKTNLIMFDTENIKSIQYILPTIGRLTPKYRIELLGHYSWLSNAQSVPVPFYYTSLFNDNHYYAISVNYDQKFAHYFGTNHSSKFPRYDMLGYDLTNYFVSAINLYGKENLSQQVPTLNIPGLILQPHFRSDAVNGGFKNRHLYLFRRTYNSTEIVFENIPE